MKRQLWASLVLLIVITTIVSGSATATQAPGEISNNTPLLFLGNMNIAPVVYLDGTTPSGVAVDIVHALAKHIPEPIEIKAMNWSEAQMLVARGDADALIQINPTEERLKIYDFSDTLLESQFSIFTRSDKIGISGLSSLRGLRVGVESGGLPQKVIEKDPQVLLTTIPNFLEGFKQLNEGSIDAIVVDYRVGSYVLAKNNIRNIKVTGEPVAFSYSSFAVKKGDRKLLNEINNALQIIKSDGTYQKILDNWKPTEVVFQTKEQITEGMYRVTTLIFLILFLIAGIWMVTIKKELTKRKSAEEKLRESEERFRVLFDQATDAILVYDVDLDRFIDANVKAELLFGCDRREVIKHSPTDFYPLDQSINLPVGESIQDHNKQVMNGEHLLFDRVIRSMKGDIRYCEVRMVRLPSADRKLIRASFIDITDRKQAEKVLIQYRDHLEELVKERTIDLQTAKEQAEKANMAKSTFLSRMSHELRTPLNAIMGFTQILIHQPNLNETQREQLQIMRSSGDHLLNLINDLLDLGRIEAQKMDIQHSAFNLPNAIQDVINFTNVKAEEKDLFFQYEPQTLLPNHVLGDERKIKQILLNLLSNAVKFTWEGGIILRTWYPDISSGVFIGEIEDSGIGISQDKLKAIFEPFSNISIERKAIYGAGLGLSITKNLVEMMQGTLEVKSEPGIGSTFRFEIVLPSVTVSEAHMMTEHQITGYEGERKRILVVDDNPANVALLVSMLEPLGFEVMTAYNGNEAVYVAGKKTPDLVLLDLLMPEMDGLDIARAFRNDPNLKQIRIIGVSAIVSPSERKQEFEIVCNDFVGKPILYAELLEKIHLSLGISWNVVMAPSVFQFPGESAEGEGTMVVPPEQILLTIVSLVKQGLFSELKSILTDLQTEGRYTPFCVQILRFSRNYDDERILSFIAGLREKENHHEE